MKNQLPPPPTATTHSDPLSLPQRSSSLRRSGAATARSSRTDPDPDPEPPVFDDPNQSEPLSLQRRTSRLRRSGAAAAHPPELPRNSRLRRPRRSAPAADPDPEPSVSNNDDPPDSEPSSLPPRNSRLRRPRRSGASASAADPDPEPSVSDSGDPTYSELSSLPPRKSLLHRFRRSVAAASASNPDPEDPVSDDDSSSDKDDPTYAEPLSLPRRSSRLLTSGAAAAHPPKPPTNSRSRRSGAASATADPDPQPPVKWVEKRGSSCSASASERVSLLNHENSKFTQDELDAAECLLPLKERANLPAKDQSSKKHTKAEEEVRDEVKDVHASESVVWNLEEGDKNSKEGDKNSKEDECRSPAVEAEWVGKQTRSRDLQIQNMIKLEFDKFSIKLGKLSNDIAEIKGILLTRDIKENVAGSD